jgi:uncharacterized protein YndB with AHSA1/START domain
MTTATTRSLVIEREIPHPLERVWRALTQGSLMKEWLMDNDFQPVVGHRFNFRSTPAPNWNGVVDCEVLAVEPNKRLSYSWCSMGLASVVSWTLSATARGTLLRFEQTGFGPGQEANYAGAKYGWQKFIGGMERVVAELK